MTCQPTGTMLPDLMEGGRRVVALDLESAGRLVGSYRWIEKQLFHVLGRWSAIVPEAGIKIFLDQQSFEFAWHAELWADRLPDHRAAGGLTAPANSGVAALFRALVDELDTSDTVEKLTAAYRVVLPRLVTAYSAHLDRATSAGNDPTQRALRLVLADELAAWRAGVAALDPLLVDESALDRSLEQQRRLEALLLRSGGIATLDT